MDIIESILQLPDQCQQAWDEASKIEVPENWVSIYDSGNCIQDPIKRIVVCGMGGSTLGAHIISSCGPIGEYITVVNNYSFPFVFGDETLVILVSYSGNTEEVLACAKEAKKLTNKIIGVTSGGKLGSWLTENKYPSYIFEPKYNETNQPRMGIGYTMIGMIAIFEKLGLYFGGYIESAIRSLNNNVIPIQKSAKDFATRLKDKLPIIFASDYLMGSAHVFANQLNENAKTLSMYFAIPEANHHLLEGLKHPKLPCVAIFLGEHYPEKIVKRFQITREILEKNSWEVLWYKPQQDDPFAQSLEVLLFSSLVTAYLGQEYGEDPLAIPNVDYFKERLKQV